MASTIAARIPVKDGFTLSATYQAGRAIIYSGVTIQYRPALQEEYIAYISDPRKPLVKMREWVLRHLTGWNVAGDVEGSVAPITLETVSELAPPVLDWIDSCVNGYAPKQEAADLGN